MANTRKKAADPASAATTDQAGQNPPASAATTEGARDGGGGGDGDAGTGEGTQAGSAAQVILAQQPGQIAAAVAGSLAAPTLDIGVQDGGVTAKAGLLPDGYPEDIELGGRTVMVQSRSARGRWRIGRHFTTEPSPVLIDELTEDQVGRLLADPELIVSLDD